MAVSTLYFYQAALKAGPGKMKFEVISMMVTGIATVLYMTMFSGAGKSFVKELGHDINPHDTRDAFYWGRYVDWILTTPLMLWDVLALAGAPADDILAAVGVDVLLKYTTVSTAGKEAQNLYCKVAYMTIVLWTLYPLVWIVSEGGRLVSPSLEACLYMIMDVSAKCVFGFMIVGARGALEKIQATDF